MSTNPALRLSFDNTNKQSNNTFNSSHLLHLLTKLSRIMAHILHTQKQVATVSDRDTGLLIGQRSQHIKEER